ncbi:phage minor head protein [Thermomonas sp.]|uniref:phage head morphogenesis protein n=1 Tax=Thermomonas sp. TaxID=1971895 RepID=UPI003D0B17C2
MPITPEELAFALGRPFPEQVAFFRGKLGDLVPTATWRDLWKDAHDRAFMVAGAARADLLADLAAAVDAAIAGGETLDQFRARFGQIVQRHGWQGWTGSDSAAGRAWRTRIIYTTNQATSYAAGRLAQLRAFPLWVYRHGASRDPRPQHLAWDGLVLPADHPFWRTHYPPSAWNCSCYVVGARDMDAALRRGGKAGYTAPPKGWDTRDSRGRLPGVDEGWDYQPGGTVADTVRTLASKLDKWPPQLSIDLIQSWIKAEAFDRWYESPRGAWPLARLPDADAQALGAKDGVRVARLSEETAIKQRREHPELTTQDYALAQQVIDDPTHKVWDGTSAIYVREVPTGGSGGHVLVVKATQTGKALFVTSFRKLHTKEARRDSEIRRLLEKGGKG